MFGRRLKLRPRIAEFRERAAELPGRLGIGLRRESRIGRTHRLLMKVSKQYLNADSIVKDFLFL